jgi:hypothetical protein
MSVFENNGARHGDGRLRRCLRYNGGDVGSADGDGATKSLDLRQPKGKPSFLAWLAVANVTDDPAGDLIDDLRRDTRKPADIPSRAELRRYLRLRRACREAIRAVPTVWRRFEAGVG